MNIPFEGDALTDDRRWKATCPQCMRGLPCEVSDALIAHKANLSRPHRTDTEWKRANLPAPQLPAELL